MVTQQALKPFLKWAGGKRQLLGDIKNYMPERIQEYTYYEPFAGAGAVFFSLCPGKAVINDRNAQLMLCYQVIKDHTEDLIGLLKTYQGRNNEASYYALRNLDRDNHAFERLTAVEKAARFIFLNKTCYNGLYRVNLRGAFNVPYGKYTNPAVCEEQLLRRIGGYLNSQSIVILNRDFAEALQGANEGSWVYFDPPYHSPDNKRFTGYQAGGFSEAEQERLRDVFMTVSGRGAKCLLSNADTPFIRNLYAQYTIIPVQAKRLINSNPAGRRAVPEVLVRSW
jgi:DNA adenine methylase